MAKEKESSLRALLKALEERKKREALGRGE